MNSISIRSLNELKKEKIPIAAVTAYDSSFASVVKDNGIEVILVGDSLSVTMAGNETTINATIDQIAYHTECVKKGLGKEGPLLIADMPFMTYSNPEEALKNAAILMRSGAEMVKCEGGRWLKDIVAKLKEQGIPFCGHLGLTPQSVFSQGYVICEGPVERERLLKDAIALEEAGMQLLILKCVQASIAKEICDKLKIPVLGIGAGVDCDGQILILQDLLGMNTHGSILLDKTFQ